MLVMILYLHKSDLVLTVNLELDFSIVQTPLFHLPQEFVECDEGTKMLFYFICFNNQKGLLIIKMCLRRSMTYSLQAYRGHLLNYLFSQDNLQNIKMLGFLAIMY